MTDISQQLFLDCIFYQAIINISIFYFVVILWQTSFLKSSLSMMEFTLLMLWELCLYGHSTTWWAKSGNPNFTKGSHLNVGDTLISLFLSSFPLWNLLASSLSTTPSSQFLSILVANTLVKVTNISHLYPLIATNSFFNFRSLSHYILYICNTKAT